MNSNKNQPPQASNEAAQTASIGDDQMMTYMKMPLNLSESASVGVANNATSSFRGKVISLAVSTKFLYHEVNSEARATKK